MFQPYHDNNTGDTSFIADISEEIIGNILYLIKERKNVLCSGSYLKGFPRFYKRDSHPDCHAGHKYFNIDPFGFLHPCVDTPSAGHLLKDDISVVRSKEALENVRSCQGCWYCFRGEADSMLSLRGCLEKARLGLTVIMRNTSCKGQRDKRVRVNSNNVGRGFLHTPPNIYSHLRRQQYCHEHQF